MSPIEVVRQVYDAFGRREIAKVFTLMSADVEMEQSEELPWGGVYKGHEGARQFFGKLTGAIHSTLEVEKADLRWGQRGSGWMDAGDGECQWRGLSGADRSCVEGAGWAGGAGAVFD